MGTPVTHSLVKTLQSVPLFAELDDAILLDVVGASSNLRWSAGRRIFEQGAPGDALFVVLGGGVRIVEDGDSDGGRVIVEPGDFFGELALLHGTPRTRSAEAAEDSELLVLPKASFDALAAATPELDDRCRRRRAELVTAAEASGAT